MKAYSVDLREKMLQAVDQGYPRTEIIKLFSVSRATIKRYLKQRRETGDVRVKPIPDRPSKKFAPLQSGLVAQLGVPTFFPPKIPAKASGRSGRGLNNADSPDA